VFVAAARPTPAVDRQLRPFVQDAHSAVRLPESRSRRSDKQTRVQLRHIMNSQPCP